MRDRDRTHLSPRPHRLDRGVVHERDHVPEHVALGRLGEQQPLADREGRLDADAEVARVLPDVAAVVAGKLLERRPLLTSGPDVLALVLADRAALRRLARLGELRRARAADELGQGVRR
jgi:hypothetical protein